MASLCRSLRARKRASLRRTRGIALLLVLVVLVLIATLATEISVTARTHYQLADHAMEELLLRTAVDGRANVLLAALRFDGTNKSNYDSEGDDWAWHNRDKLSGWGERGQSSFGTVTGDESGGQIFKNSTVELTAWCEDERSKINLRGLLRAEETPEFKATRDALVRLIDVYREKWSNLDLSESQASEMVDALVKWLQAEADTEENPMPAVKTGRGRLQCVDDLLRVPGGFWTVERLFDVKDPNLDADAEESGTTNTDETYSSDSGLPDPAWERPNGIPGLWRYLTVFSENMENPELRININTASVPVLKALFEANDEDFAQKIVDYRRQGADETDSATGTGTGTGSTTDQTWDPLESTCRHASLSIL